MDRDDWKSQIELDRWTNELERLSNRNYKTADTAMFNAYKEALTEIKADLKNYVENYETLSFSKRLEAERLFKTANDIDQVLDTTYKVVGQETIKYKTAEAQLGYNGVFYAMEGRENLQFTSIGIDRKFIERTVNAPVAGKRLSTRLYQNRTKLAREATNMIIRETAKGKSYAHIAKRIADRTEASYKQALRIARTEAGQVRTIATQRGYEDAAKLGVKGLKKRWLAGMDSRTRSSHGRADGQTVDYDENFKIGRYEGPGPRNMGAAAEDINCRCTTIAIVDDVEPQLRRIDGQITDYKSYAEWAKTKGIRLPTPPTPTPASVTPIGKIFSPGTSLKQKDKILLKNYEAELDRMENYVDLRSYTNQAYIPINNAHRAGTFNKLNPAQKRVSDRIDKLIDGYNLEYDLEVYRAVSGQWATQLKDYKPGDVISDNAFGSASISKTAADKFMSKKIGQDSVMMRINVPSGKGRGVYIGTESAYNSEYEFLMKRGARLAVVRNENNIIDLEMIVDGK